MFRDGGRSYRLQVESCKLGRVLRLRQTLPNSGTDKHGGEDTDFTNSHEFFREQEHEDEDEGEMGTKEGVGTLTYE